jgi:hypothetical protein
MKDKIFLRGLVCGIALGELFPLIINAIGG